MQLHSNLDRRHSHQFDEQVLKYILFELLNG